MTQERKSDCPAENPAQAELDKRRQPRFDSAQQLWREGQADPKSTMALNMSQSGMFIVADEEAEVGQQLQVSFREADEEIALQLEVVWKGKATQDGPEGIGTRIVGFSAGQDVYERFVRRNLHSPATGQRNDGGPNGRASQREQPKSPEAARPRSVPPVK